MLPPLIVTLSVPVPVVTEPTEPAPLLKVSVLLPSPRSRLPLSEPPLFTVALSLPRPRFTDSTPLKAKPSMVPALAPETSRVSAAMVELIRSLLPEPPTIASSSVKVSAPPLETEPLAVPELTLVSVIDWVALSAL